MHFGVFLEFPVTGGGTQRDAFQESFALVDEAERLGVDSVWLPEYHFNSGRVLSSPRTTASAIAARTQRTRIGLGVQCLPLGHPVRMAEEAATVDLISGGRLEFGVGRGTFPNVHEGYHEGYHVYPSPTAGDALRSSWRLFGRRGRRSTSPSYEINSGNQLSYEHQVTSLRLFNQQVVPRFK